MKIRTKISQTINLRKYLNISVALFLFGFNSYLFSQEENKNQESNINNKNHQFGFTIKRANYAYYPVEYTNSMERTSLFGGIEDSNFLGSIDSKKRGLNKTNNEQVINPFSISYYNKKINLNFEFSYYKIILDSPYYLEIFPKASQSASNINFLNYDIGNIRRSENKLNIYSNIKPNENHSFFYGLGLRNIRKEKYERNGFSQNSTLDDTYGINLYFKYQYKILSRLSLNVLLEPFYTYGNRSIKQDSIEYLISPNRFSLYYNNPNARIYFYGGEFDINLSFNFFENFNLLIGYGFIYTKIRYENDKRLYIVNSFGNISMPSYTSSYIYSTDHINNWYIGLNAKF